MRILGKDCGQVNDFCFAIILMLFNNAVNGQTTPIIGNGVGIIPDGVSGVCTDNGIGSDLVISFEVPAKFIITDIQVDIDMYHDYVGDLSATLVAPDGDDHVLFSRTGTTTVFDCGSTDDIDGHYAFSDILPTLGNWWNQDSPYPSGNYRSTTPGRVASGGQEAVITDSFDLSYLAGTWELRVNDSVIDGIGGVRAATLRITTLDSCSPKPCLTTTLNPLNSSNGVFFDITAKDQDIIIKSIDFVPTDNSEFQLFHKLGSYKTFENNATPWLAGQRRDISGNGISLRNYLASNEIIKAGQTVGFLLATDRSISDAARVRFRNESDLFVTENSDFELFSDTSIGGSGLTPIQVFESGTTGEDNRFSGIIYYQVGDESCYVLITQNNNGVTFCL
jgi:subtilisin-like proprotein convertase family protein